MHYLLMVEGKGTFGEVKVEEKDAMNWFDHEKGMYPIQQNLLSI